MPKMPAGPIVRAAIARRQRHASAKRTNARATLEAMRIPVGADFHALSSSQVDALIAEADRVRYQRPANANGSRARYFHDRLQRQARKEGK
ncbi:MAG TPA: hypothetical protein VIU64_17510 [Polyangia bacterium]